MGILKGLLDRIVFAFGLILFMQVPQFVDQYEHRLGGYFQAQVDYLQQYQKIADEQFQGSLLALIKDFNSSNKQSVKQTGINIREAQIQSEQLNIDLQVLANKSFIEKLIHLSTTLKVDIARATIQSLNPALPLSVEAFICGLLGAIVVSLLCNFCFGLPKLLFSKSTRSNKRKDSGVKKRVEPTIMRPVSAA